MLLLGWSELELKAGADGGCYWYGAQRKGWGGAGAPVDGTDISGQVVLKQ